jgi:Ser/Thr protein kinase RdoA (MazF antagonist)
MPLFISTHTTRAEALTRIPDHPDIAHWPHLELVERLAGGARSCAFLARRRNRQFVVRQSSRPTRSLEWELELLAHLSRQGVRVPQVLLTDDGRQHVDGVVVQQFLPGGRPRSRRDWEHVIKTVQRVHELTAGWPQRPGFRSSRQLLDADSGGDVRFAEMPAELAQIVRTAWMPILRGDECAIHGDLGGGNVLVDGSKVALVDWDEARVDIPWFDFAHVPREVAVPAPVDREALITAGVAWEAATCWVPEPDYARRRMAELRKRL